jgi:hypothetical protein
MVSDGVQRRTPWSAGPGRGGWGERAFTNRRPYQLSLIATFKAQDGHIAPNAQVCISRPLVELVPFYFNQPRCTFATGST